MNAIGVIPTGGVTDVLDVLETIITTVDNEYYEVAKILKKDDIKVRTVNYSPKSNYSEKVTFFRTRRQNLYRILEFEKKDGKRVITYDTTASFK